jgi:hypothetical protein
MTVAGLEFQEGEGLWTVVHLMPDNCSADEWPEVDSSVFLLFCYMNPVASGRLSSSLLSLFWNNISLMLKQLSSIWNFFLCLDPLCQKLYEFCQ